MNKRGVALIFGLVVITVFSVLATSYFMRTMNENNWVKRETNSIRAFWLAEAGAAQAIAALPSTTALSGTLESNIRYQYSTTTTFISSGATDIYRIDANGAVSIPGGGSVQRNVEVYISLDPPDPEAFGYALEAEGEIKFTGSADIGPEGHDYNEYASISFPDRIGLSTDEAEVIAENDGVHTTVANAGDNYVPSGIEDSIHWVDIQAPLKQARIPQEGWTGSGILIVNGELELNGGTFYGIIWVIGKLSIAGNADIHGAIIAECGSEIKTSVTGNPQLTWDPDAIEDALGLLETYSPRSVITWREGQ